MREKKLVVMSAVGILALLAIILVLVLINRNNGGFQKGGEGTNFPYSWKEESGGTVLLKLDGSSGPEGYHWNITSTDASVLSVKVVKKEKNGVITYRIKPLMEGSVQIVFSMQRDVETLAGASKESLEGKESVAASDVQNGKNEQDALADEDIEGQLIDEMSEEVDPSEAAEEASAAMAASQRYEDYLERHRAKDVIGEVKVRLDAQPTGKKNKLVLSFVLAQVQEYKGVMQNTAGEGEIAYQLWEDEKGSVQIRLPELGESWSVTWDGEYAPEEDVEVPGITIPKPKIVDGKYMILEVREEGFLEGAYCYTVMGEYKGSATLEFSNPKSEKSLLVYVMISKDGKITVVSHGMEAPQG